MDIFCGQSKLAQTSAKRTGIIIDRKRGKCMTIEIVGEDAFDGTAIIT